MSAATQFFGGGGDPAPANGTDIRIHLVGMGAGGGGGQGGGGGGAGRLLDMTNAIVSTGSTINITIGNGGPSPGADGVPRLAGGQPGAPRPAVRRGPCRPRHSRRRRSWPAARSDPASRRPS